MELVVAGAITTAVDHYYPEYREDRAMIGFTISSTAIILVEGVNIAIDGNARGQLLDIASHMADAALGAWMTDKYILSPVVKNSPPIEGEYIGLALQYAF